MLLYSCIPQSGTDSVWMSPHLHLLAAATAAAAPAAAVTAAAPAAAALAAAGVAEVD